MARVARMLHSLCWSTWHVQLPAAGTASSTPPSNPVHLLGHWAQEESHGHIQGLGLSSAIITRVLWNDLACRSGWMRVAGARLSLPASGRGGQPNLCFLGNRHYHVFLKCSPTQESLPSVCIKSQTIEISNYWKGATNHLLQLLKGCDKSSLTTIERVWPIGSYDYWKGTTNQLLQLLKGFNQWYFSNMFEQYVTSNVKTENYDLH